LHFGSAEFGIGDWRQIAERAVRPEILAIVDDFTRECLALVPDT
jgi:hypothetical protein